ncbi:MAG TPA: DUF1428 domain-containing protein [Sphingomicrobium sp.]|nr:DUF1428 domain-containing protein [Sphingomicrobium sp.]
MSYIEGFIAPVSASGREAYEHHARAFAAIAPELGIKRMVEGWADDVPRGKLTDFYRAVAANEEETVVFSWFEYPSRKERDAANEKFRTDPRMNDLMGKVPFDAKRMIFGGFETILDSGKGPGGYVSGFIAPVPRERKDAYREMNERQAPIFQEHGALRFVQAWADDVPEGQVTDFRRAVRAEQSEDVVLAFIEWPSKQANLEGWDRIMKDERMQHTGEPPFDGKRLFWGGFEVIVDTARSQLAAATAAPITA